MSKFLMISCSLNPESRSRLLARAGFEVLRSTQEDCDYIDLADISLPMCDGAGAYSDSQVGELTEIVSQAEGILIATPIYNFDINAAAKNLIELTGSAWNDKVVGFFCSAGGGGSYMSIMSFANSLMLDFRCLIVPRFVYAVTDDFIDDEIKEKIQTRIKELVDTFVDLTLKVK